VVSEEAGRFDQEQRCGRGRLVREDLAEGDPGAVIDGRVEGVVADPALASWGPAVDAVATTIRDAAQLLDIEWSSSPGCSRW
jgi:hypothetical protein